MTDYELLELAAKAAGVDVPKKFGPWDQYSDSRGFERVNMDGSAVKWRWSPLTDDGDALRLAVKAGIAFRYERNAPPELHLPRECAIAITGNGRYFSDVAKDEMTATRRAIVRAAAEIGRGM